MGNAADRFGLVLILLRGGQQSCPACLSKTGTGRRVLHMMGDVVLANSRRRTMTIKASMTVPKFMLPNAGTETGQGNDGGGDGCGAGDSAFLEAPGLVAISTRKMPMVMLMVIVTLELHVTMTVVLRVMFFHQDADATE